MGLFIYVFLFVLSFALYLFGVPPAVMVEPYIAAWAFAGAGLILLLLTVPWRRNRSEAVPQAREEGRKAEAIELAEAKDAERMGMLEAERDALREQHTEVLLKYEEAVAKAERLKKENAAAADVEAVRQAALAELLAGLQDKGRFIDFVKDDISSISDAQVGAGARFVHQGLSRFVNEHFKIEPVFPGVEGAQHSLQEGYDARAWRLSGRTTGHPPFAGNVLHKGWKLIAAGHEYVLTPAELEIA